MYKRQLWAGWFVPQGGGTLTITLNAAASTTQGIYDNTVSAASIDVTILSFVGAPVMVVGLNDLQLTTESPVTTAQPGEMITYTITYTNTGIQTLNNIVVYDQLSDDVLFVSATPSLDVGFPDPTGLIQWTIGTVGIGGSGSVSYIIEVK